MKAEIKTKILGWASMKSNTDPLWKESYLNLMSIKD